ncbi:tRNA preQ1(34) S-adenosylmethionine ribosyltransferase-isomerase QueA [Paenalcaligenes faecalis]|uniref:tRNA preQ1(34) S-adenosylmethionine ribosyltransferase-isomerase QueA n=1 Tax=Paenalcaligenes faecalis TaxID=2980099 RepID=UPI0022B987B6|nr:tRNA preQ1(34) S-adenosylmethionine ribosyltransferase-isomerase QueA [Paenalcaligenes faecalis]
MPLILFIMSASANLTLSLFDYDLPDELIAQHPTAVRGGSRLLHIDRNGNHHDSFFNALPQLLTPGDLLVFNNTQVIKARLQGQKDSGGKVEVLIERVIDEHNALAHIRASKSPKPNTQLIFAEGALRLTVTGRDDALFCVRFDQPALDALEQYGALPLPPYITHSAESSDEERYQTVFAQHPGAVAAPTAGLHFDQAMLDQLKAQGIESAFVTLHVGAGTFQPVRVDNISEHQMHAERYSVPAKTLALIKKTREAGHRVIAVGTTSVRALESAAQPELTQGITLANGDINGDTRIFITPGYVFHYVDALITNFHLPQSTLLMLVSALAGMEPIRNAYNHAVQMHYRFFSYGDAMFIEKPNS